MFDTIFGLPLHPLVVHATEVFVPLAALLVVLTAAWPRFRQWGGYLTLGTALVALALVPISKESGEQLEHRVGENSLIETHAELADGLLPWVIGLAVVAAALVWCVSAWTESGTTTTPPAAPPPAATRPPSRSSTPTTRWKRTPSRRSTPTHRRRDAHASRVIVTFTCRWLL